MKYIRVKEGIFPCLDTNTLKVGDLVGINEPILAKSDTIEELCDEFRVRDNDDYSTYEIDITCRDLEELYEELQIQNQTLFGAIWTNKGLIYVAKMNDKGELELL